MNLCAKKVFIPTLNCSFTYELTSHTETSEENSSVPVYGIAIYEEGKKESQSSLYYSCIDDISTDYETVNDIYNTVISNTLLPIHLYDVIPELID